VGDNHPRYDGKKLASNDAGRDGPEGGATVKLPIRNPGPNPNAVLVSYCPRCGRLIRCPGLTAIKCDGEQGCGATHDRGREPGDA